MHFWKFLCRQRNSILQVEVIRNKFWLLWSFLWCVSQNYTDHEPCLLVNVMFGKLEIFPYSLNFELLWPEKSFCYFLADNTHKRITSFALDPKTISWKIGLCWSYHKIVQVSKHKNLENSQITFFCILKIRWLALYRRYTGFSLQ